MKSRLKRLQAELVKNNLDALLVRVWEGDNQNVLYLSGFGGSTGILLVARENAYIIADPRYWLRVEQEVKDFQLIKLERGAKAPESINTLLRENDLGPESRLGFESAHVSVHLLEHWKKEIQATLVPTWHLIERFRQYKDESEIEALRQACDVTSRVYEEVVPLIKPGISETDLAFEIDMRLRKHGAVTNSFTTIVASGPNSAIPHHATSQRKLAPGEPVVMDFGGLFPGGYCSDITRTAFVPGKEPDDRMVEIYNIVLEANKAALEAVKPGIHWKEFDKVARDRIEQAGYGKYFTHGLGHSLGLVAHDPFDYENDPFEVGTVVTDEPGIYVDGLGGVRIEDDLVVTANGAELLTTAPYWTF